jgi:hypothetical protein
MNSLLAELSAAQLRRAAAIKEQINRLEAELETLVGSPNRNQATRRFSHKGLGTKRSRRKMSAAAKAKIAAAARLRWKKAKAAGRNAL